MDANQRPQRPRLGSHYRVYECAEAAENSYEWCGKHGSFAAIAEIMLVFVLSLNCYEVRVESYGTVNYNAHDEALEGHISTNLDAAWVKVKYYDKLDDTVIYYTVTLPRPYYAIYCEQA